MLTPLLERELRVALLHRGARRQWVAGAWLAGGICLAFLLSCGLVSARGAGPALFRLLFALGSLGVVWRGFGLTADLFSEERRSGTLGLLVLTGLSPLEIFTNKLLGVAHATRFLGHRSGAELAELYKVCDVVCLPSRNEPFGITALEGWAAGKPVVASQSGGPSEFIWHNVNGLKVAPTPESIAWGIQTVFTDFEWARWMGANGRRADETAFSWDTVAEKTEQCYRA